MQDRDDVQRVTAVDDCALDDDLKTVIVPLNSSDLFEKGKNCDAVVHILLI